MKPFNLLFALLLLVCSSKLSGQTATPLVPEAMSFSGRPFYSQPAEPKTLAKSDSIINAIKSKGKLIEDDFIEIGKQLSATNRYRLAAENYSAGLAKYPGSYKLLRLRGHRYINLRKLDKSIADLTKAEELIRSEPDVMEYDVAKKPTATYRHQIWYHIGVYHYLKKDYNKSAVAFEKAVATGGDLKNVVGASDWLYNCYQRLGQKEKAEKLLTPITPESDTDKENPYFRRIMLYKGVITPDQLIDVTTAPEKMVVADITKLYGLANWYAYHGEKQKAQGLYAIILKSDAWPGFAYAAAEIDMSAK